MAIALTWPRVGALIAVVALAASGAWALAAMPSCDDAQLVHDVTAKVRADYKIDSILVGGIETLGGWRFGKRTCRALVTEIKGNADLTQRTWMQIQYTSPLSVMVYQMTGWKTPPLQER